MSHLNKDILLNLFSQIKIFLENCAFWWGGGWFWVEADYFTHGGNSRMLMLLRRAARSAADDYFLSKFQEDLELRTCVNIHEFFNTELDS